MFPVACINLKAIVEIPVDYAFFEIQKDKTQKAVFCILFYVRQFVAYPVFVL